MYISFSPSPMPHWIVHTCCRQLLNNVSSGTSIYPIKNQVKRPRSKQSQYKFQSKNGDCSILEYKLLKRLKQLEQRTVETLPSTGLLPYRNTATNDRPMFQMEYKWKFSWFKWSFEAADWLMNSSGVSIGIAQSRHVPNTLYNEKQDKIISYIHSMMQYCIIQGSGLKQPQTSVLEMYTKPAIYSYEYSPLNLLPAVTLKRSEIATKIKLIELKWVQNFMNDDYIVNSTVQI